MENLIVQKYGGTSVANKQKMAAVANHIEKTHQAGNNVIVVVSAMGKETDELIKLAHEFSDNPDQRELDMLMATGEQKSVALLGMLMKARGIPALSLVAGQIGFETTTEYGEARIKTIRDQDKIQSYLNKGLIVICAGFQGVDENREITTLGRGGSDTTAVALAVTFDAKCCEIYTDVDGVYPIDPRLVKGVKRLRNLDYGLMHTFSEAGAGVVHYRAVELAQRFGLKLKILLSPSLGTSTNETIICNQVDKNNLETLIWPTLIAVKNNLSIVTVDGITDKSGESAKITSIFKEAKINIFEKQQGSSTLRGKAKQDFLIRIVEAKIILPILQRKRPDLKITSKDGWVQITVVDPRKAENPGFCYQIESAIGRSRVNMRMQGGSNQSYWVVVKSDDKQASTYALAKEFHLI